MRGFFAEGTGITWKQYRSKSESLHMIRSGSIWSHAPRFEGEAGAFVWVIPDEPRLNEKSAIAVVVHRSGARRGEAEVFEDAASYREHSLRE